ncbi:hypothetical protein OK016_00465 [Vibrio chagasii]|nr:hypothetical protein [Vibrio chagasii]
MQSKHKQLLPIIDQAISKLSGEQLDALAKSGCMDTGFNTNTTVPYTELYDLTKEATVEGSMVRRVELNGEIKHLYLKKIDTGEHYS